MRTLSTRRHREAGFTLIELMVAMLIFSIVAAISLWGLRSYQRSQELSGSAHGVLAALRSASERAVSESRTYCVEFSGTHDWSIWRYSCDPHEVTTPAAPLQVGGGHTDGGGTIAAAALTAPTGPIFAHGCPAGADQCAYFYPRGIAAGGTVTVARSGSPAAYIVNVDGVTGRVYLTS